MDEFTLVEYPGTPVSLSGLRGKVALNAIWNPACVPCRMGLPALQSQRVENRSRGFEVVAIESYGQSEKARGIIEKLGLSCTCLEDSAGLSAAASLRRGTPAPSG